MSIFTSIPRFSGDALTIQQRRDNNFTLDEGFDSGAFPSGWSFAGAPFVNPTWDAAGTPSFFVITLTGIQRAFLTFNVLPDPAILPVIFVGWILGNVNTFGGFRMDDGSDNNYFEWLLSGDLKGTVRTRIGGGAVGTVQGTSMIIPQIYGIRMNRTGTKYSSWGANVFFTMQWQGALIQGLQAASATTTANWIPTRYGILVDNIAAGTIVFGVDSILH